MGSLKNMSSNRIIQLSLLTTIPFLVGLLSSKFIPQDWIASWRRGGEQYSTVTSRTSTYSNDIDSINTSNKVSRKIVIGRGEGSRMDDSHKIVNNKALDRMIGQFNGGNDAFANVKMVLHRNGESESCGSQSHEVDFSKVLRQEIINYNIPFDKMTKHDFDAMFTDLMIGILPNESCGVITDSMADNTTAQGILSFCDMGESRTPILPDHQDLIPIDVSPNSDGSETYFPCHFHTREGIRILSLSQLADVAKELKDTEHEMDEPSNGGQKETCSVTSSGEQVCVRTPQIAKVKELHLYAVPAGRIFVFAPSFVGETFDLSHVRLSENDEHVVSLKVLSISPRVFEVKNFFNKEESDAIVHSALTETSESHRMRRSSTGATGYNLNSKRTSENAFDTQSTEAMAVKRRCFQVLGLDVYHESMADGLQVLRYNKSTAYVDHMDWIEDDYKREEHDYDSSGVGTNRFATILLYMSDLPEEGGGETVFMSGWPAGQEDSDLMDIQTAMDKVRREGLVHLFKRNSWEETLVAHCRSRLSVKPASAKAVLFYSQLPDGRVDESSSHGGCPVLDGEKWAANLWVWNGIRAGYEGSPVNKEVVEKNRRENEDGENESEPPQLKAIFENTGTDPRYDKAQLFYEDSFWGDLGHGDEPLSVNTYEGHRWLVKVNSEVVMQWTIAENPSLQKFYL